MTSGDGGSRISLSMLRGKTVNQSVPSISFRYNHGSEDLVKVCEEERSNGSSGVVDELSPENEKVSSHSGDPSPSRREPRSLTQRSSSLDESTISSSPEPILPTKSPVDAPSILSRITKRVEHKFNEIRNDKQLKLKDGELSGSDVNAASEQEKLSKAFDSIKRFSMEKDADVLISSPSKGKTTLAQDFAEHTNKIKSEINKNIRPKLSELRNRKSMSRDKENPSGGGGVIKSKSSLLQSLLGRDDTVTAADMLRECHAVDTAVEAHEDLPQVSVPLTQTENTLDKTSAVLPSVVEKEPCERSEKSVPIASTPQPSADLVTSLIFLAQSAAAAEWRGLAAKIGVTLFVLCFVLPLPRFLAGSIFGISLAAIALLALARALMPPPARDEVKLQNINITEAKVIQTHTPSSEENALYVGWINELDGGYDPKKYHVSHTHTVLLRLQGSTLQIDNSRKKISKHARPNEELQYGIFVHHREYDLSGCEVILLPKNLPRRWLWSRKYPILIRLQPRLQQTYPANTPSHPSSVSSTPTKPFHDSFSRPQSPDASSCGGSGCELGEEDDLASYEEVTSAMCQETMLCLFARTDREKDDWFRRFVFASIFRSTFSTALSDLTPEEIGPAPFESSLDGDNGIADSASESLPLKASEPQPTETSTKWALGAHYKCIV